ncbi:MAG: hypothetical protein M1834_001044 [Cirrosporium novae-zelandiae]|nr:MAG: hypothetical protein M1834_001044 [Cirrosporium novae-zelandiae]
MAVLGSLAGASTLVYSKITPLNLILIRRPITHITPTMLLVNDPAQLPVIYHRQADKSKHYITGSFGETESIFNIQDYKVHAAHRKLIAGPVNLKLDYMAYDIISTLAFGAPFGFISTGSDVASLIQGFHDGLPACGLMCRLYPLKKYLVAKPTDNTGIGILMRFRDKLLAQRIRELQEGKYCKDGMDGRQRRDFLQFPNPHLHSHSPNCRSNV